MRRTIVAILAFAFAGAGSVGAQAPQQRPAGAPPTGSGEVRGMVVDAADSTPVVRASIALRAARDSALVTGAVTAENGSFRIQGLRPGRYYLRITSIGYGPRSTVAFAISDTAPTMTFGAIRMTRVATTLQEVAVTAERAAITVEGDRTVYQARQVAPAATNASEVLANTPSVEVDADGKVSLRGNENVAVQINGRPTPIRGAQLGQYLKQLPGSTVERIEVIPTPSARQDPEGMAGIINIVLRQQVDMGRSWGLTIAGSPQQRYNVSTNVGNQSGAWTLFGTYGYNADQRDVVGVNNRERYSGTAFVSATEQSVNGQNKAGGHNVTGTIEYKFNPRDILSNNTSLNIRGMNQDELTLYRELNAGRVQTDEYFRARKADVDGFNFDNAVTFRRTIEQRRNELSAEVRYTRSNNDDVLNMWRQPVTAGGSTEFEEATTDSHTDQVNLQLDVTRPLGPRAKLETGYKGTGRFLDRDYLLLEDDAGTGTWTRSDRSNSFQFDEQVHAVYGVLTRTAGNFELQGGLRAERASRDFVLSSASHPYDYTSLFPSAIVNYKFSDANTLRAAYSRRIRRPGTEELNPFPMFMDPNNAMVGNPQLNPEYTDAYELSWNRNYKLGSLQVSPFYRRTTDVIRFIIDTDAVIDGREVTRVSFENLDVGESWGTDVNGSLRLGPKLSGFAGFNVHKMVTEGGSVSSVLSSDAVLWSARINATTELTPTFAIQANYFHRGPQKVERGEFARQHMLNVVLRRRVQNNKGTISLRVVDPFNTMGFRVQARNDDLSQLTTRKFGARAVFLNYQFSWGQAPRVRRPVEQAPEQPVSPFGN